MKILSIFLAFLLSFSLYGCYDSKEIDETAYIIALGIDKAASSGFNYTFQFSAPLATTNHEGGGGETEGDSKENPTVRNIVINSPDFYTAKNLTNNFLSKTVDMSHLKLIVFSASVDQDGFLQHSQFMLREREVRPHTAMALSLTTAEDFLKSVNPELEANTAKYYELMSLRSNNVYAPTKKLSDFVDEINSPSGVSCLPTALSESSLKASSKQSKVSPWVSPGDTSVKSKKAQLQGMAIFKNGQPTVVSDSNFALIYNILNRDIKSCIITLENPHIENSFLSFRLNIPSSAVYTFERKERPCKIMVSQGLEVTPLGHSLPRGFSSEAELYDYARSVLEKEFTDYFYHLSRTAIADIMKIGDSAKKSFLTQAEWEKYDWERVFGGAEFKVEISFM